MMFSSNQSLEVSGCLSHSGELYTALEFALKFSGDLERFLRKEKPGKCVYQITEQGHYCIGWAFGEIKKGWNEFPFDFDLEIISKIIAKHLEKQIIHGEYGDGSYHKGFYMRCIPNSWADEKDGIKNPFYGIVEFFPYTCFYAK